MRLQWTLVTLLLGAGSWLSPVVPAQESPPQQVARGQDPQVDDEFLRIGTEEGPGGQDWQRFERSHTKDLIRGFIPPLLRPAFVEHAFVLPPNAFQLATSYRNATIGGDDFFRNPRKGDEEPGSAFEDFEVKRQFLDFDFFYGFDFGRKYLHGFTARLNLPILFYETEGSAHPNGFDLVKVFPEASGSELGDIGLFFKKKFLDQTDFPIQIAGVGGVQFPTGANDKKFNDGGRIKMQRPDPSGGTAQTGPPPLDMPIPIAMLRPLPQQTTPFIFNCDAGRTSPLCGTNTHPGVFWRFNDDGRLPTTLQPGTGTFSFLTALFFTRVNQPYFLLGRNLGRSAFHWGAAHLFRQEKDGIDPGDQTTIFGSFVKPVYFFEDLLALDLSFVTFRLSGDSYKGRIYLPTPTDGMGNPVATWQQASTVTFRERDRAPFARGWTGFIAPSLILSPDPSIRFTASGLVRVLEPEIGPAPDFVIRGAVEVIF